MKHWIDELADELFEKLSKRGKEVLVFNGGLSVSGLQHVGRLRGEIIIAETLRRILSKRGLKIKQYLTLYTQDSWKGKDAQLRAFPSPSEAERYRGNPLISVPDPRGCHDNWVEHYWGDFGPFIKDFTDGQIEVVTTTDLYRGRLKDFVKIVLSKREEVRKVVNKYRGRKPYEEGWIPIEPVCERCGRIDTTEAVKILDDEHVEYACTHCGHRGVAHISNGKLMWRIEWVGVWWALQVDFEPFGKDHAMPGGSRDSCVDLAVNVFGLNPPIGLPYEWVEWRKSDGKVVDMGSSDFLGFTPKDWVEVAHPHIYRFLVLKTPPMKKFAVGLHEVPSYYNQYYRAERIYYGLEKATSEEERVILSRSYELSYPDGDPPPDPPEQIPYSHAAILAQILPENLLIEEGINRLKHTGHLSLNPTSYGLKRAREILVKARTWVSKYAPEEYRFTILPEPNTEALKDAPGDIIGALRAMRDNLLKLSEWREDEIKNAVLTITSAMGERVGLFYKYFYKLIVGKESGPRAIPLLAMLGREAALKYFSSID